MNRLSRDEIIERGIEAAKKGAESHNPWIYYANAKVGRGRTHNVEGQYYSIRHMMGELVQKYAKENEVLHIYGISRVMKSQLRSQREDV